MAKPDVDICKGALQTGVAECNGEDLLTECKNLSRRLNIPDLTEGHYNKCIFRNAIWSENDNKIKAKLSGTPLK